LRQLARLRVALAVGGATEGVGHGVHERLGHLFDHRAEYVDAALLEESAHLLKTVHRNLDHRVSPFIVL
jgi:hypothetical protein